MLTGGSEGGRPRLTEFALFGSRLENQIRSVHFFDLSYLS